MMTSTKTSLNKMSTNNCPLQTNLACFITTDAINIEQMSFYRHHVVTLVKNICQKICRCRKAATTSHQCHL